MSEHGVPIGPGPWQPTPGFFGSLLVRHVEVYVGIACKTRCGSAAPLESSRARDPSM
jgi:hypothetical protein